MIKTHPSHQMRYSDSSGYDEVCNNCGEPDWNSSDNKKLGLPCIAVAIEEKQEISDKNSFIRSDMKSARDFYKKLEARAADKGVYLTVDATAELEKLFKEAYYDGYQAAVDSVKSIQIGGVTSDTFGAYKKMIVDILETSSNILKSSGQK